MQSAAAAAALILTVFIPNVLCSEFATEPLVLRVFMPGAHWSSTWASGVCIWDKSSSVMSDSFLTSPSSQFENIHWDLLFLWDKKLFHAQKTWEEKPLSALERKTCQDRGSSDSGKLTSHRDTNIEVISGLSLGRVSPVKQVVSKLQTECTLRDQRQSFPGLQQGGLYVKTGCGAASPAPCWSISLLLAMLLIKTRLAGAWISHLPALHSGKLRHLQLPRNAGDPFMKKLQVFVPVKSSGSSRTELQL